MMTLKYLGKKIKSTAQSFFLAYKYWNCVVAVMQMTSELIHPEEITFVVKSTYDRVAFEYSMLKWVSILLGSNIMHKLPFKENYYFSCLKNVL